MRLHPKSFYQRRPDAKSQHWINSLEGVRRVPYRLPKILQAEDIFIVEGEKDVHTLERLGFIATTNAGGAGKWPADFKQYFNFNQNLVILPDNDEPGRKHAQDVAIALAGIVKSIKILSLPGLPEKGDVSDWIKGKNLTQAAEELSLLADCAPEWMPNQSYNDETAIHLWDISQINEWPAEPLTWFVENLIPKGGIGFLSGAPKDGKTLLALDLCIHLAHGKSWLNRFSVSPAKTLYIAREDPRRRLKERILEINASYGYENFPTAFVKFLIRDRFNLMASEWIDWLKRVNDEHNFDFLVLDVLNRMIPELDELSAKDMGRMVSQLETVNRDLNLTILNIDHTRKPVGPKSERDNREPNPFDLKGSVAKYGCADFMLCLSRTDQDRRLQLYCENKDSDSRPHFMIDVSPKDSGKPKFTWAGDIEKFGRDSKAQGDANRQKVLEKITSEWISPKVVKDMLAGIIKADTVQKHFNDLEKAGLVERRGKTHQTMWRKTYRTADESCNPATNANNGIINDELLFS